jgi:RNA polymerase sigma factor (sigma-70 family)
MELSDTELMLLVRDGDVDKLSHLFERHHVKLYNFFLRMSGNREASQDMVQEVFLRLLKYRQSYQARGSFTTWLFRIASNVRIDAFRQKRPNMNLDDVAESLVSVEPHPDAELELQQNTSYLQQALALLAPEKREAVLLSKFHHLKYEEIAHIQRCKVGAVKSKIHRALKEVAENYFQLSGDRI